MQLLRGSGKTAVLVERIIQKILNDGVDIDKLLVVTFTNAAASEMRERILDAIYKKLDENPNDDNLKRQIILLGKSNICTIHSFCLNVIKNNFFELDLSANFRIASEEEIELLKQEILDDIFEELYADEENEEFIRLVDTYTGYRGDDPLKEIVFNIYKVIQSMPFPQKWLDEKVELLNECKDKKDNFSQSIWGSKIVDNLKDELLDCANNLKIVCNKISKYEEMDKFAITIQDDIEKILKLENMLNDWDLAYQYSAEMSFSNWPKDKKANPDMKDEAKKVRDNVKKRINDLIDKTLLYDSENAYQDIYLCYENMNSIKNLIFKFDEKFKATKREKNIIDFSDIEHYALEILVKEENGRYVPTDVAKKYQEKFEEIAIDEYQDSNRIQEMILKNVSKGNNIFMVGDVKQSIYKFRQACPKLFMEKYENYTLEGNEIGQKIKLFKNFRSSKMILDIVNNIFENIMSKKLGEIDYTEEEFLNLGADYPQIDDGLGKSEIDIIDLENIEDIDNEDEEENEKVELNRTEIEANFVRRKIEELIKSKKKTKCKDGSYRDVTYKDIVILLRSTAKHSSIFEKELISHNIPVYSDSNNEYLETFEIQTIITLLRIIDNPLNDINLVAILRSPIFNFTDNELLEIRLINKSESFYNNLVNIANSPEEKLYSKVCSFLNSINNWKNESQFMSLAEFIWKIYLDTGFLNYVGFMKNGELKQANLKMLFERAKDYEKTSFCGLFNFIRYIEKLKSTNSDMGQAKIIGENENVVRIMSIHKSKGLEFPIVFLCNSNKKINMKDLSNSILINDEMGFGPQYINYDRKIEYPTASKQAIKIIGKNEIISEEMRILYVALTRAKEKLIITGTSKKIKDEIEKKKEFLNIYSKESENNINPVLVRKYISYLDWIELVYLKGVLDSSLELNIIPNKKNDEEIEKDDVNYKFDFSKKIDENNIENELSWKYENEILTQTPIKVSVSDIKKQNNEQNIGLELISNEFGKENKTISASQKGTIMHFVLQRLDFRRKYDEDGLEEFLCNLVQKKFLTQDEKMAVNKNNILNFINSEMYDRIQNAKEIFKEKTFCTKMKLTEYGMNEVLVQGIVDLYFIDENDKIVLIDYKTDLANEGELVEKYKVQLEIYAEAIENSMKKSVNEKYIYSTYLDKFIKINN